MYISRIYEIKLNDYNKFIIFIKMNIWIKKYIKKKNNKNLLYIHLRFVKEIKLEIFLQKIRQIVMA